MKPVRHQWSAVGSRRAKQSKRKAKRAITRRRLGIEPFESRVLLAADALIGIDFDTSGAAPPGFVQMSGFSDTTFTDVANVHFEQTEIDLTVDLPTATSTNFSNGPITGSLIPTSNPPLNAIDGLYRWDAVNLSSPLRIIASGLDAGQDYNVYLIGVGKYNSGADQTVTMTGQNTVTFSQVFAANQAFFNDELGDSSRTLESFAEVITADASGEITVSMTTTISMSIGGFAIRPTAAADPAAGAIAGRIYDDANGDNVLNLNENGLVGETVYLDLNTNGQFDTGEPTAVTIADDPATTGADESGGYSFSGLSAGTYQVRLSAPAGIEVTGPVSGFGTGIVTATAGAVVNLATQPFSGVIDGFVWHDVNADGIYRDSESRLVGRTVYLDLNDNSVLDTGEPSQITTADDPQTNRNEAGAYRFDLLPSGSYIVRQVIETGDQITAPVDPADVFNLELVLGGELTLSQREIFYNAAATWEGIIVDDVPDSVSLGIDDIVVNASASFIDGPNNILGSAGPRNLRGGSSLPTGGVMTFDTADLAILESNGGLQDVVLHEMGHTLGFTSSVWTPQGLVQGLGTSTPTFTGTTAVAEYNALFGGNSTTVPVENDGGSGTAGSHWEESIFDEELMTGFYDGGRDNPVSRVTVGALQDMGYGVDFDGAEFFDPNLEADPVTSSKIKGVFLTSDPPSDGEGDNQNDGMSSVVSNQLDAYSVTLTPGESVFQVRFGVTSVEADFGDAPASYLTSYLEDGPRHADSGPQLGAARDNDLDGNPSATADADGIDDDGVLFGELRLDATMAGVNIDLQNTATAKVDAWIDFAGDGVFDPSDQIFAGETVSAGLQTLMYSVPNTAVAGETFARVRISTAGGLDPNGFATDGEVEDYPLTITQVSSVNLPNGSSNNVTIRLAGNDVEVVDNNDSQSVIASFPVASTQTIELNAGDQDDQITVDYSSGFFAFSGGIQIDAAAGADQLTVIGTPTSRATYQNGGVTLGDASIVVLDNLVWNEISFINFEPVSVNNVLTFHVDGTLAVGSETLTVDSNIMASLDDLTTISGGVLASESGWAIGSGETLIGNGAIAGAVAAGLGSTISLDGDLQAGDAMADDGFTTDGRLIVGSNTLTVMDANTAVLGSLTQLGVSGAAGTVSAVNGLLVDFGSNVTGFGTLDSPDDVIRRTVINGAVTGITSNQSITLTGFIKGVGTLDHVQTTGTYSPGFSPAQIFGGSLKLSDSSRTVIELGGTTPGDSGHDQLVQSGTLGVDGILEIALINDFVPDEGDVFEIITTASGITGNFNSVNLPAIDPELAWFADFQNDKINLEVIRRPKVDDIAVGSGTVGANGDRSIVREVTVTFNTLVEFNQADGAAIEIINRRSAQEIGLKTMVDESSGKTIVSLQFMDGVSVESLAGGATTLADGSYQLLIHADRVIVRDLELDGDGDNVGGDSFLFGDDTVDNFFRLFGDTDGDRDVDASDYGRVTSTLFKSSGDAGFDASYDNDGDGDVDGIDFAELRSRLNQQLPF